jgi:Na+-translocating ferredoxin:NAD+ oxidoreductase RnfG subunit
MKHCFIFLFLLNATPLFAQNEPAMAERKLHELFGDDIKLETKTATLTDSTRKAILDLSGVPYNASSVKVQVATVAGKTYFGIIDNVMGKAQPITYLVVFDRDEKIKAVEVLIYRESYGGEIEYKSFRSQFDGKTYSSELHVGTDVRNISGATISANAITRGVKKVAALLHTIKEQLK